MLFGLFSNAVLASAAMFILCSLGQTVLDCVAGVEFPALGTDAATPGFGFVCESALRISVEEMVGVELL
jgi:hypothetical protein